MLLDLTYSIRTYVMLLSVNSRTEEGFTLDLRARGGCAELYTSPGHPWTTAKATTSLIVPNVAFAVRIS